MHAYSWLHSPFERVLLSKYGGKMRSLLQILKLPVVLQDVYRIKTVLYPWDRRPADSILFRGFYRSELTAIRGLVRPSDTVFDVGSNIGLHTVWMDRLVGPQGKVYAFEPVPETFRILIKTIRLNHCQSAIPHSLALSDMSGTTTIHVFEPQYSEFNTMGLPAMPGLDGEKVHPKGVVEVEATTLDTFCLEHGIHRINFMKVDVEGFEKQVFMGGRRLLGERRIDCLSFEISQDPLKGLGICPREVFEVLEDHGYRSYRFDEMSGRFDGPVHDSTDYYQVYFASYRDLLSPEDRNTTPFSSETSEIGLGHNR